MMKIGVISDTHLKESGNLLVKVVDKYFKDADLILHAGDLTSMKVLDAFDGKEVIAVAGNSDTADVKQHLPEREIITAGNFRIGLIHGWGLPMGLEKRVTFSFDRIHCLVFGHSHLAVNRRRNGIYYFNPGSFSRGIYSLWQRSIGLLTIDRDIKGEIIRI